MMAKGLNKLLKILIEGGSKGFRCKEALEEEGRRTLCTLTAATREMTQQVGPFQTPSGK